MIDLRADSPETLAWQAERTAETLAALHAVDGYAAFGAAVLRYSDAAQRWTPVHAGGRWFQLRRVDPAAELPAITVRDAVDDEPRVLIDVNHHTAPGGPPISLSWMTPSPDGSVVAYAIAAEGAEVNQVVLLDVASGERRSDTVPWNVLFPPSWLPDSSGFWCMSKEIGADGVRTPIRRFILDEPASDWSAPLPEDLLFPNPKVSEDGHYVSVGAGNTQMRTDYVITKDLQVMRILVGVPGSFRGVIADEAFYALTDNHAPRGRIVRIPLDTSSDTDTWTELVAESTDTIADFAIFGDDLVVASIRECSAAIDVVDLKTNRRESVSLPGAGGIGALAERAFHPGLPVFARDADGLTFIYSDLATAPAVYRYVADERRLVCLEAPATALQGMTVSYITTTSADGVEVPAHVIHRADLDLDRPHPTLLTGYGGFQVAELPAYVNGHAAWLDAGGIYVLAHLRGGGEFGADWWRDGRRESKQNSFNDFYAVAEKLIGLGWTTSEKLAIYGASNGGLLAAAALTQRPELWAAVVADVPVTDLLHMDDTPLLYAIGREEYGDPTVPEEWRWMETIDPLVNAKPADYPATLVIAGANDPRCPASQARQLVDKVRTAQLGTAPIRLRVHAEQGHGAQGAIEVADRLTEILAFCAAHTGLALAQL